MRVQNKVMRDLASTSSHWQQSLANQIQQDLINAREMVTRTGELRLRGFCGHDPTSQEVTHRLAEVVYSTRDVGGHFCLVRDERLLGKQYTNNITTEVVGIGITGIVLLGRENDEDNKHSIDWIGSLQIQNKKKTRKEQHRADEWIPIPKVFRLILTGADRQTVVEKLVVL